MTPDVVAAIAEIRALFPGHRVEVEPESQGGAYVTVHDLSLGRSYTPQRGWIGFLVPYQYPDTDVYPHFTDAALVCADGAPLDSAFQRVPWQGRAATQISRRSNRWDPATDTAAVKLRKVLAWLSNH